MTPRPAEAQSAGVASGRFSPRQSRLTAACGGTPSGHEEGLEHDVHREGVGCLVACHFPPFLPLDEWKYR